MSHQVNDPFPTRAKDIGETPQILGDSPHEGADAPEPAAEEPEIIVIEEVPPSAEQDTQGKEGDASHPEPEP